MKLYYSPAACSLSPHIVLLQAGIPFSIQRADLKTKKTDTGGDFLTVNSKGAVPALQLDDGRILTEGAVIVQYLADLKPQSGLAPPIGSYERYELASILNYIASMRYKGSSPLVQSRASHPSGRPRPWPTCDKEVHLAVGSPRREALFVGWTFHGRRCVLVYRAELDLASRASTSPNGPC